MQWDARATKGQSLDLNSDLRAESPVWDLLWRVSSSSFPLLTGLALGKSRKNAELVVCPNPQQTRRLGAVRVQLVLCRRGAVAGGSGEPHRGAVVAQGSPLWTRGERPFFLPPRSHRLHLQ